VSHWHLLRLSQSLPPHPLVDLLGWWVAGRASTDNAIIQLPGGKVLPSGNDDQQVQVHMLQERIVTSADTTPGCRGGNPGTGDTPTWPGSAVPGAAKMVVSVLLPMLKKGPLIGVAG
jgi:hypothetical protein